MSGLQNSTGSGTGLARLAAEECRQKAEQIREHYRDLVADYGLAFCARQAAEEDERYGNGRFF